MKNNLNNTNGFSSAEYSGRTFFEHILDDSASVTDIQFTQTRFDSVDVFWTKNGKKNVGEIKYRINYASTSSTIDEGVMIEKIKYDALMSYYHTQGIQPYYISFFKDDKAIIFDLSKIDKPNWVEEKNKFPKTTMGESIGDKKKVPKVVGYLKLELGKKINYIQKVD